jgi:hypothetical protein
LNESRSVGSARLVNPQAGLAFDMQGPDSHALAHARRTKIRQRRTGGRDSGKATGWRSREIFRSWIMKAIHLITLAVNDLGRFSDLRAPKAAGGFVTPSVLFRGMTRGDLIGPYISQFFWKETPFGAETIDRRMRTGAAFTDYMTTYSEWLAIQTGASARPASFDPTPRYVRNGRDLGEWGPSGRSVSGLLRGAADSFSRSGLHLTPTSLRGFRKSDWFWDARRILLSRAFFAPLQRAHSRRLVSKMVRAPAVTAGSICGRVHNSRDTQRHVSDSP